MKSLIIEAGIPTAAGRRALLLGCALAIGLLTVGCRLFGGGEELAEVHGPADYQPTDISDDWTDEDLVAPGSDAPIQGPRPGQLLPFPELRTIYFDYDRSEIRLDQTDNIDHNLQYILDHSEEKVYIAGHCDERGTVQYNFALGWRRANAVKDYFVRNGVDADRITVVSRGKEQPASLGNGDEARAKNRRCEFKRMY